MPSDLIVRQIKTDTGTAVDTLRLISITLEGDNFKARYSETREYEDGYTRPLAAYEINRAISEMGPDVAALVETAKQLAETARQEDEDQRAADAQKAADAIAAAQAQQAQQPAPPVGP